MKLNDEHCNAGLQEHDEPVVQQVEIWVSLTAWGPDSRPCFYRGTLVCLPQM